MKKLIGWLLILALCTGWCGALGEGTETVPEELQELTVVNPTHMNGNFFSSMWGNVTSDLDVQRLIHGYNLIMWDESGSMYKEDDSVVNGVLKTEDPEGDYIYTLSLYDDLYYSDGSKITAWDYAFSLLFEMAPQVVEIGGTPLRMDYIKGYGEYISGQSKGLAGVRVADDLSLEIVVDHDYLPFFYEMGLLYCFPVPISEIAPGCRVYDDGEGVYIAAADNPEDTGAFSSELLEKNVLDPETGYLSHPRVVSGPYVLTGFDGTTATFEINPYFKGTSGGAKPSIPRLTYTLGDNGTMVNELAEGKVGLLNKVTYSEAIQQGIESGAQMKSYPRTGLSFISFVWESVPVQSLNVRQAIAYCLDKKELVSGYTGMYGMEVKGYYGIGQWMYELVSGSTPPPVEADNEEELAAWEALNLDGLETYDKGSREENVKEAVRLLEEDGWVLEDGASVRSKEIDGTRYDLNLRLVYPRGNHIADRMDACLGDILAEAGVGLELIPMENEELMRTYYHQRERNCDMIYLGSNFHPVYDPSVSFMTNPVIDGWPTWNNSASQAGELEEASVALRRTHPGDVLGYCRNWIKFQEVFSRVLPVIPVYSNIYFDFYTEKLKDYNVDANVTWAEAIIGARLSDGTEETEEAGDDEPEILD